MIGTVLVVARHHAHGRGLRGPAAALVAAIVLAGALPSVVLAHPLGNFTINHYAGIRVTPGEILLDVVVDQAEIPTFQARLDLDSDGDGTLSPAETDGAREPACRSLLADLDVSVDGRAVTPTLVAAGLHFPSGAGGLQTMRLVCEMRVPLEGGLGQGREVRFADRSYPDRLGWREIVAEGDGTSVDARGTALPATVSQRLTEYPEDRLATPLAMAEARLHVTSGGGRPPPWRVPDASPLVGPAGPVGTAAPSAAVPGGAGADLPAIFSSTDLSPVALLLAVVTALALGAGHALTPGHGKSLLAAYLVGTRGTGVHALGLGLSVAASHTLGILVLAALVVIAHGALALDLVVRWLPLVAALTIAAIGAWMVASELRRRGGRVAHPHPDDHRHPHVPEHEGASTVTWRSLFALGFAGGVIPSTSALLILLGTIAAGRPAFGVLLLIAFGLGMALVLGGLGLLLVRGRSVLGRLHSRPSVQRLAAWAPLAAAVVVLSVGIWLTVQTVVGMPAL